MKEMVRVWSSCFMSLYGRLISAPSQMVDDSWDMVEGLDPREVTVEKSNQLHITGR